MKLSSQKPLNRQVARTRKLLQNALLELMKDEPLKSISITQITNKADVARPTFYAHFETKEALLMSHVEEILDIFMHKIFLEQVEGIEPTAEVSPNCHFFMELEKNPYLTRLLVTPEISNMLLERLIEFHHGTFGNFIAPSRPDIPIALAEFYIYFIAHTTLGLIRKWVDNDMKEDGELLGNILSQLTGPTNFIPFIEQFKDQIV